jgi:hypothetical protein
VLLKGKVCGFGVCCAKQAEGQRPITEIEWATRRIELKDGLLATPFREKPEHFPAILDIRVNAEDVRRECAKAIKVSQAEAKANGASAPPSDDDVRALIRAKENELGHRPSIRMWGEWPEMSEHGVTKSQFERVWSEIYPDPPKGRPKKMPQ